MLDSKRQRPQDMVRKVTGERLVGEVLFWLRPVVYATLLKKYGRQSWTPWAVSLMMDVVSHMASRKQLSRQYVAVVGLLLRVKQETLSKPTLTSME